MKFLFIPVASGVIIKSNKILIGLRAEGDSGAGMWEFPGGKIELNESSEDAIKRELREELDIEATVNQKIMKYSHRFKNTIYEISFFEINKFTGSIKKNVHDDLQWIELASLKKYQFISGDLLLIDRILANPTLLNGLTIN
ncbi:(deoxy)nucleoside triphosphate pyrophosphohydrolase [bacterium]|jgi:mutator protein MutT|nr:(deoxy)nucleoside triphosphate pyrophosphohydrolase [bacterium]